MDNVKITFRSKLKTTLMMFTVAFGTFHYGYMMTSFNPIQKIVSTEAEWGDNQTLYIALVSAFVPLGGLFGSMACSVFIQKFGRKRTLYLADAITVVGSLFSIWLNIGLLLICRLIYGFGLGINMMITPIFIREALPRAFSGAYGTISEHMLNIGKITLFILAFGLAHEDDVVNRTASEFGLNWWRFIMAFPAFVSIFRTVMIFFVFNFETPCHSYAIGNEQEVKKYVNYMFTDDCHEKVLEEFKKDSSKKDKSSYGEVLNKEYRSRTFTVITLAFLRQWSAINVISFYSQSIFIESGLAPRSTMEAISNVINIVFSIIQVLTLLAAGILLDKQGRKPYFFLGELIAALSHTFLSLFFFLDLKAAIPFFVLLYGVGFGLALGPIIMIYVPEIHTPHGCGVFNIFNWFFGFLIGFVFPFMIQKIYIDGFFLIIALICYFGCIWTIFFFKETKGLNRHEIARLFYKGPHLGKDEDDDEEEEEEGIMDMNDKEDNDGNKNDDKSDLSSKITNGLQTQGRI